MFVFEVVFVTLFVLITLGAVLFAFYISIFGLPEKHESARQRHAREYHESRSRQRREALRVYRQSHRG